MPRIDIYDTTLRDGVQGADISYSVESQLRIVERLDNLGVSFIEAGQPESNPKSKSFFARLREMKLTHANLVAFGKTRHPRSAVEEDAGLRSLLDAETEWVAIVAKSWDLHVDKVLGITLDKNLTIIDDTVRFLKQNGRSVIFDAEHFFDGYKHAPDYAVKTLEVARDAGADTLVLCDTNGSSLPSTVGDVTRVVKEQLAVPLGIHTHNDVGMAVAAVVAAVESGATQVHGTVNGYGERCGNADLCALIAVIALKLGLDCIPQDRLRGITELSHFVAELSNMAPDDRQPFVGRFAFLHKGGMHVDAVAKDATTYEHIDPELVGNRRRIAISEVSGKRSVIEKADELGLELGRSHEEARHVLEQVKDLESDGYHYEGAEASFELIVKKSTGEYRSFFDLAGFRVIVEKRDDGRLISEATIKVKVGDKEEHTAAEGNGPVDALDHALRKALEKFYPILREMHLTDFKVRILDSQAATAARTRVLIESSDQLRTWGTVGVSENIIEASYQALVDAVEYKLLKDLASST